MLTSFHLVLVYIGISSVSLGINAEFASYLVAIANGASGLGRLASGLASDKIGERISADIFQHFHLRSTTGPLNTMIPTTFAAGVLTLAWPFARSVASLTVLAIIYG